MNTAFSHFQQYRNKAELGKNKGPLIPVYSFIKKNYCWILKKIGMKPYCLIVIAFL